MLARWVWGIETPSSTASSETVCPGASTEPARADVVVHLQLGVTATILRGWPEEFVSLKAPFPPAFGAMKPRSRIGGSTVIGGRPSWVPGGRVTAGAWLPAGVAGMPGAGATGATAGVPRPPGAPGAWPNAAATGARSRIPATRVKIVTIETECTNPIPARLRGFGGVSRTAQTDRRPFLKMCSFT